MNVHGDLDQFAKTKVDANKSNELLKQSVNESAHVLTLFENRVIFSPNEIAIIAGNEAITFDTLNNWGNKLAWLLREKNVSVGDPVLIHLDTSVEVIVGILACFKVGAVYIPLGKEIPFDRIKAIAADASCKIMISCNSLMAKNDFPEVECIKLDEFTWTSSDHYKNLETELSANDLAYIIYTSGSTGNPKGVMLEHKALSNYLLWAADYYLAGQPETFPFYTSISFDMTVTSIFLPLITGNKIVVYAGEGNEFVLNKVLADNQATILKLTPSHMKLIKHLDLSSSKVKMLIVGGEELETNLAKDLYKAFSGVKIINEYGPTEAAVGCIVHEFCNDDNVNESVPIGLPIYNTDIHLLDKSFNEVEPGQEGEIYIGGDSLARGYLNRIDLTEKVFINSPFMESQLLYKTGDLAIYDPLTKNFIYRGRIDGQVKIRGHRIETKEIESLILQFQNEKHLNSVARITKPNEVDLLAVSRCKICIDRIDTIDIKEHDSICPKCRSFEEYKDKAKDYFSNESAFYKEIKSSPKFGHGKYDALLCFSGGKDSTYVLHKMVENGLRVLAFTFDNGYISKIAFDNMRKATEKLGVELVILNAASIRDIFIDSLFEEANICNGCFKSINTLALKLAWDNDVNFVVTGLSRGQVFDIDIHGLFKIGIYDDSEIEKRLIEFRKKYFSKSNKVSRLLDVDISDEMVQNVRILNYFRYDDVSTSDVIKYLSDQRRDWVRPPDTGSSSTNCRLNDASIYFHVKEKGDHFYTSQLSWDVRLNTITRDHAFQEISEFELTDQTAEKILTAIGFYDPTKGAVVIAEKNDSLEGITLKAFVVTNARTKISELRHYLQQKLPEYMIPDQLISIDKIPLTASGKVDIQLLKTMEPKEENIRIITENDINLASDQVSSIVTGILSVWSDVLGLTENEIELDVDFFELGGHSFKYVLMLAKLQEKYNHTFDIDMTGKITISSLANMIEYQ